MKITAYHGSQFNSDFNSFSTEHQNTDAPENSFFFTSSPETAYTFTGSFPSEKRVIEVELTLENPMIVDFKGDSWQDSKSFNGNYGNANELAQWAKDDGYDGCIFKNIQDKGYGGFPFSNYFSEREDLESNIDYVVFSNDQIKIKSRGYKFKRPKGLIGVSYIDYLNKERIFYEHFKEVYKLPKELEEMPERLRMKFEPLLDNDRKVFEFDYYSTAVGYKTAFIKIKKENKMRKEIFEIDREIQINEDTILEIGDKVEIISEGINDKNLFKCVFLAGGPGSGKSFISNKMFSTSGISPLGVKLVNSDFFYELGLKRKNLPLVIQDKSTDIGSQQAMIRIGAKASAELKRGLHIDSMLPFIIDGTSKDYARVTDQALYLQSKGYDTAMVFINTTLETAKKRNKKRTRVVPEKMLIASWNKVQANIGKFNNFFNKSGGYLVVDNDTEIEKGSAELKDFMDSLFFSGKKMIEKPLRNVKGKEIIKALKASGGKYLSDLSDI